MGCRSLLTAAALVATLGVTAPPVFAQQAPSDRVLAQPDSGFNPSAVQALITTATLQHPVGTSRPLKLNTRKPSRRRVFSQTSIGAWGAHFVAWMLESHVRWI